jgi:hypothetical protein
VIPFKYDDAWGFTGDDYRGLAVVQSGDKYGFVNSEGKEVTPCIYDDAWSTEGDKMGRMKLNDQFGAVSFDGKEVIKPGLDEIKIYHGTVYCRIDDEIYDIKVRDLVNSDGTYIDVNFRNCPWCHGNGGKENQEYKYETRTREENINGQLVWNGSHLVKASTITIEEYLKVPDGTAWVDCKHCDGTGCYRGKINNRGLKWDEANKTYQVEVPDIY